VSEEIGLEASSLMMDRRKRRWTCSRRLRLVSERFETSDLLQAKTLLSELDHRRPLHRAQAALNRAGRRFPMSDADMDSRRGPALAPASALRFRVDSVTHFSKLFRPFQEPPFSALPLFVRSRWIEKPVQLRGSQAESLRSSFLGSRLGWLRYCERLLEEAANCFRTGQSSILAAHPSIQSGKLGRL
jgi:hypothetical protein